MAEKSCGLEEGGSGGFFIAAIRVRVKGKQCAAVEAISLTREN